MSFPSQTPTAAELAKVEHFLTQLAIYYGEVNASVTLHDEPKSIYIAFGKADFKRRFYSLSSHFEKESGCLSESHLARDDFQQLVNFWNQFSSFYGETETPVGVHFPKGVPSYNIYQYCIKEKIIDTMTSILRFMDHRLFGNSPKKDDLPGRSLPVGVTTPSHWGRKSSSAQPPVHHVHTVNIPRFQGRPEDCVLVPETQVRLHCTPENSACPLTER